MVVLCVVVGGDAMEERENAKDHKTTTTKKHTSAFTEGVT